MTKHPKRPRDPAQLAKLMVDIATGEVEDIEAKTDPSAVALGRQGGMARAQALTKVQRSEIAKKAARKRWEGS